jgi:uncharacterized protein YndB with AHSA1/START domain
MSVGPGMMCPMPGEIGETKDVGFEIGVSRRIPFDRHAVWELLVSPEGQAVWVGPGVTLEPVRGFRYQSDDGTTGEVRSFRELDRIRLTWRPAGWDHDSTVQVTVSGPEHATTLRFHQEWLADGAERERQRAYWTAVLDRLVATLEQR